MRYEIRCEWDTEAGVWYVAESNVPGLATEAATAEAMFEKLRTLIPELLAANRADSDTEVPITLLMRREEDLHLSC